MKQDSLKSKEKDGEILKRFSFLSSSFAVHFSLDNGYKL